MSKRNEIPALVVSLLVTLALLVSGLYLMRSRLPLAAIADLFWPGTPVRPVSRQVLAGRLSRGELSLLPGTPSPATEQGLEAFAQKDYVTATARFEAALQAQRNNPETLIYLNNARIGQAKAYTLAVAVPIGTEPKPAQEILRGIAQAQQEINQAGGINGVPLKVLIVSDDNDPDISAGLAALLVDDPDILAVVGHFGSSTTLAAAPIYEAGQLVMISPTSTAVSLTNAGRYIYRTVPSDRLAASALARYMLTELDSQRAAVFFTSESDYSRSIKNEFTTALLSDGGDMVAELDLSAANFDAGQLVRQALQQNAEVLVLAANTATLDKALQVIAVNRQQLPLLGGDSLYNPKILEVGGTSALGLVVAVPWHILDQPQAPFAESSRQLWGGDVSWRTAMTYDATQALIKALEISPTREGIQTTLQAAGFKTAGATQPVRFFASGDRNQPSQLAKVVEGSRSGYGYDFVPVDFAPTAN